MATVFFLTLPQLATAATVQVSGNISFISPSVLKKTEDIEFTGRIHPAAGDDVVMDTSGYVRIIGVGTVEDPHGQPGRIIVRDIRDQVVSFLPSNYAPRPGIATLKAMCSTDGSGKSDQPCEQLSGLMTGKGEKTLHVGMGVKVEDPARLEASSFSASSFDMFVVCQ